VTAILVAAAKSSSASTLFVVFLAIGAFLVGGAISFYSRKQWPGVVITALLAIGSFALAFSYYRTYKAG
jgi:hypothetical protein